MTRDVATAARLLTVIAGSDPADPATRDADAKRSDYAKALDANALKGVRIGVLRFATGGVKPVEALFDAALGVLRAQGAVLVEIDTKPDMGKIGTAEIVALLAEFKADLNTYLASTPSAVTVRSVDQLIAFNRAHADTEMALIGQELIEAAAQMPALDNADYRQARATAVRMAGAEGIDAMLSSANVVALVAPTAPPAGFIDAVNGNGQGADVGAGKLAAVAGTPHLTVPMGAVRGLPVGLSFMGPAWSEARLIGLGYAYEQASHKIVAPTFVPSIEGTPTVSKLLAPAPR
jgi:amidase